MTEAKVEPNIESVVELMDSLTIRAKGPIQRLECPIYGEEVAALRLALGLPLRRGLFAEAIFSRGVNDRPALLIENEFLSETKDPETLLQRAQFLVELVDQDLDRLDALRRKI